MIHGYGLVKLKEIQKYLVLKDEDLNQRQEISLPFFQAQNEIRQSIQYRREDLTAKKVLDEKQYKLYQELRRPFKLTIDEPPLTIR
jgi:predicted RNase H-like nuclease